MTHNINSTHNIATMASSSAHYQSDVKQVPFPVKLKRLLGDAHTISDLKARLTEHAKSLDLNGWRIDADLRKRRQKLEVKILTILKEFQGSMVDHNWVKFIETSSAGHATLMQRIDELTTQMSDILHEYNKYTIFLDDIKDTKKTFDEQSETLSSALDHMKFTEKYRHRTYGDDYEAHQLRPAMDWNGWQ